MINGIEKIKNHFSGYDYAYVIIGGSACSVLMEEENLDFRLTKDIDMVLILEEVDKKFAEKFWSFILDGEYKHINKSDNSEQFYRFQDPKNNEYPKMVEIFTRKPEGIEIPSNVRLIPIHIEDSVSSLSAILLNDEYYEFLKKGQKLVDGINVLDAEHLIPFKAKAYIDLKQRKSNGEHVDSKNINKHKNDIFRLSRIITGEKVGISTIIYNDLMEFINQMEKETIDLKQLGIRTSNKEEILNDILNIYDVQK